MIPAIMICFAFNVLNALHDAWRIKKHLKIKHWINGTLYLIVVAVCSFIWSWLLILPLLCLRPLVFDSLLNIFRGNDLDYQPENPESVIDDWENRLFGSLAWELSTLLYLVGFVAGIVLVQIS